MAFLGGLLGSGLGTYEQPGTGLLGRLGTNLRGDNPLFNLTMAYLAQLGPSTTPVNPLQRLGRAGLAASEANQNALQNELVREKIKESKTERENLGRLQEFFKDNPDIVAANPTLSALIQYGGPEAIRGIASTYADPTLADRIATTTAERALKETEVQ